MKYEGVERSIFTPSEEFTNKLFFPLFFFLTDGETEHKKTYSLLGSLGGRGSLNTFCRQPIVEGVLKTDH